MQKCNVCKCTKLLSLFKIKENTGIIYKTCIKCNERVKCDRDGCNYICSRNSELQRHLKAVHDKIKDIKCDWENCEYSCSLDHHLKQHVNQVHDKIKDFECDRENCDFSCSQSSKLQQHVKQVHDKIKNFECPNCDYKCSQNGNLQRHVKFVHHKIKDIKCPNCDYTCSRNGNLKKHIKNVHEKIKDFECSKCDYKCSSNGDLQKHIEICTGLRNISSGEFKMIECFEELGFYEDEDYIHDSTFSELTTSCGKRLRFDFMFINHKRVFEYDGEQHIRPVKFGGMSQEQAEENFQKTVENDKLKDDFCKNNGYKMVRISYKDYPNILSILHCELLDIMDNVG